MFGLEAIVMEENLPLSFVAISMMRSATLGRITCRIFRTFGSDGFFIE